MNHDAFVSYASTDRVLAYQMVDYLESCGIRCWVAPRDVPGGRNYAEAILSALVESKLFLLIFSDNSNGSEHVQREVERALHLSKPIVPVRIKDVLPSGAMDYYLATLHWIDAFSPDAEESDVHSELGREDAARAAGALLGRGDEVNEAIADIHRERKEAEERRIAAEQKLRLKAEAESKAKLEAEAEARRLQLEEEQRRELEAALEKQRKQEQLEAEKRRRLEDRQREKERRQLEAERADQERREARQKAKAEARAKAAAAGQAKLSAAGASSKSGGEAAPVSGASTRQLLVIVLCLVVMLVGVGIWAKGFFQMPEREVVEKTPLEPLPIISPPVEVEPLTVSRLRAYFEWDGERHTVAYSEILLFSSTNTPLQGRTARKGEILEIRLPESDAAFDADFTLFIPGFEPVSKTASISEGDVEVEFGALIRLMAEVGVSSDYADQPRAREAHQPFLKDLQLVWQGSALDPGSALVRNEAAVEWLDKLQSNSLDETWRCSPILEEGTTATLPTGRYRAILKTACTAPFDKVSLAEIEVSGLVEAPPLVTVPIVPLGVFGGETAWTSTTTEAGRDEDGTVAWTLYNLPESADFAGSVPRVVQSYTDIVSKGELLKKYFLPSPITEVAYESEAARWHLLADPKAFVNDLDDDDLTDRYFEKIEFYLRYHGDKRGILFDAETTDQPLNVTEGTIREFTLQNAYPNFSEPIDTLSARYPGFGVLDVNKVYAYLEPLDKENARAYRRSATTPTSMETPVPVTLGVEPDLDFAGSGNVRLSKIAAGGPGEEAGLKTGDLLVSLGGSPVEDIEDYYRIRFGLGAGIATEVQVLRDGDLRTLVITPNAAQ